jgi:hypothetical protein
MSCPADNSKDARPILFLPAISHPRLLLCPCSISLIRWNTGWSKRRMVSGRNCLSTVVTNVNLCKRLLERDRIGKSIWKYLTSTFTCDCTNLLVDDQFDRRFIQRKDALKKIPFNEQKKEFKALNREWEEFYEDILRGFLGNHTYRDVPLGSEFTRLLMTSQAFNCISNHEGPLYHRLMDEQSSISLTNVPSLVQDQQDRASTIGVQTPRSVRRGTIRIHLKQKCRV